MLSLCDCKCLSKVKCILKMVEISCTILSLIKLYSLNNSFPSIVLLVCNLSVVFRSYMCEIWTLRSVIWYSVFQFTTMGNNTATSWFYSFQLFQNCLYSHIWKLPVISNRRASFCGTASMMASSMNIPRQLKPTVKDLFYV